VTTASIPPDLARSVEQSNDLWMTPTRVVFSGDREAEPGLAAGSSLTLPGAERYQIYLLFSLAEQVKTLELLRNAVISTGAILVILLTFIAALVSRQVVTPVRAARQTAESIASGNLGDRMPVRGQDDLARLAASMNYMASELEKQITTLEELSAVQQQFVSDVSHELRTPLTTVRMAAEVLYEAREDFDPVSARSAELMQTELDRFEALLTDLLEISRFDAGVALLSTDVVDLNDIVTQVLEANALLARSQGCPSPCTAPARRGRGRRPADRADPAQPGGQRHRAQRGQADRGAGGERPARRGRGGPRPRRRVRGQPGQAGVPPLLAGRPGSEPDRRAAAVWAWPSPWRTRTCTAAG
jgi:two-component system sensor histidine kinase MtrB